MRFQVPQYVDLEDKLAFRLTLKQLGWFALGGFVLFVVWVVFEKWVFWLMFPVVIALAAAFAFWRPAGLSLAEFLFNGFRYLVLPKELTWVKGLNDTSLLTEYGREDIEEEKGELSESLQKKKEAIGDLDRLADILDKTSDI